MKVVSLTGIRIRLSSPHLSVDGIGWARIEGLLGDETPFAFGGAHLPFTVEWQCDAPDVIAFESPVGVSHFFSRCIALLSDDDERTLEQQVRDSPSGSFPGSSDDHRARAK